MSYNEIFFALYIAILISIPLIVILGFVLNWCYSEDRLKAIGGE